MSQKIIYGIVALILIVLVLWGFSPNKTVKTGNQVQKNNMDKQNCQTMQIDKSKKYYATLKTEKGDIEIEVFADKTPVTANNFICLARQGFYDGTVFHRTIPGFMIQGGDPLGNGTGGPGYTIPDEKFEGDYEAGTVAMARTLAPNSAGSQFFIMHKSVPLDKVYVIFGKVSKGIEVVDSIATAPTRSEGEGSSPVNPIKIKTIEIREN